MEKVKEREDSVGRPRKGGVGRDSVISTGRHQGSGEREGGCVWSEIVT